MRTIIETLQAGIPAVYGIAGTHLEILSAEFPVSVSLQSASGVEITNGRSDSVEAGTYFNPREGFGQFVITSAQSQQVIIGLSNGESGTRRVAGTVTIAGTPNVEVVNVPNVTVANPNAQEQFHRYGASYKSSNLLPVNTPEVVFTAAANVNGAVLIAATFSELASASGVSKITTLVARLSAPANVLDGDVIASSEHAGIGTSETWFVASGKLAHPVFIPPGKGLYFITDRVTSAAVRSALYKLL